MSLRLGGKGWVTPLGSGVAEVWTRLLAGERAILEKIESPAGGSSYPAFRVPASALAGAPAHPRLRRASAISRFAVVAGLAALEDAQLKLDPASAERTALIFAISNGGVVYTKRFYHDIVQTGAQAASPLLFPETVFNAPASHLAAILGLTGASYTLVGDGAVGILALKMAEDLMQNSALDRCLVVGAEEADWLLCDAFHRWRLLRNTEPLNVFEQRPRGTILSEGAGAVVIDRTGQIELEQIDGGTNFKRRRQAAATVEAVWQRLHASEADVIVASANGTFVDQAEQSAITRQAPDAKVFAPKTALGEAVGASALWQVIAAAQILQTQQVPQGASVTPETPLRRALVSSCGMNQQVAGLTLRLSA